MENPNKKDIKKLKKILEKVQVLELLHDELSQETVSFLIEAFTKPTKMHLYNYDRNITDTIREIEETN